MQRHEYTDVHRSFLQACANLGSIDIQQALKVFQSSWDKGEHTDPPTETDMREIIDQINKRIHEFDQKIVLITFEQDNKEYVVFTNTSDTGIEKLQLLYTDDEVEFFRLILKELAEADNHSIHQLSALNVVNQIPSTKLTKNRAQELIGIWFIEGYLFEIDEQITFGPRTQSEFNYYLRANYSESVATCTLCKTSVFKGVQCDSPECGSRFHRHCMRKFLAKKSNCPKCKSIWNVALS